MAISNLTTSINKTITIGAAGNNRIVVALLGQSRSPTALSNIKFDGVVGTLAVSSDDGGDIAAIYYWLEADLPASAGSYTFTHSFLVNCSLVYAEGVVQAAPNDTKVLADVVTGGTNVTELERYVDLSLASVGDLCVHAAVRFSTTDGAISGCTDIQAAVGYPTSYTVTQTNIGHGEDTLPDEFAAASFAAIASGLTIDSTDASMQRNTNFEVVCSTPTTTPTTGNTTLTNGNDTLTPSSVTGSDPYTLTFPVGDLSKQVDGTGYDWTLEITP